jgi:deferrochelatase/peroxidase EfeB
MQDRLAHGDALNEYIQHVGSAHFAIPPGVTTEDGWIGQGLFA